MAAATRAALACCLAALMVACWAPTVSGAWPWDLGLTKNKTNSTDVSSSPSQIANSSSTAAAAESNAALSPSPRSRPSKSSRRSESKAILKKQQQQQPTTSKTVVKDSDAKSTAASSSAPSGTEVLPSTTEELPAAQQNSLSPIVIVEPDSSSGRPYSYPYGFGPRLSQSYGGVYPPPLPYLGPSPYPPPMPYPLPPPPPPLPPYMSAYSPYSVGGYPPYQWPAAEPQYQRPYRSSPFSPYQQGYPVPGYPFGDYPSYPWGMSPMSAMAQGQKQGSLMIGDAAGDAGCSSEVEKDRESVSSEQADKLASKEVNEPNPTHVSLLPAGPAEARNPVASKEDVATNDHILRSNPYQSRLSYAWPGYYGAQQWRGAQWPQQPYLQAAPSAAEKTHRKRQASDPHRKWRHTRRRHHA